MRVTDITTSNSSNIKTDSVINTTAISKAEENLNTNDLSENQGDFKLNNEEKTLAEAVEHANKAIEGSGRYFKYEVHDATNQVVISVMNEKTDEVIREIPSKKLLDVIAKLMELAGVMVDERR